MPFFLDFDTLRLVWWLLIGVLLIAFALTDGYDLGVATLLPFVARTDVERRMVINSVAPHWEGHQVWFILGGGALFAAWPFVYAVSFSGLYLAMFVVLAALILRPVGFKYRSKKEDPAWRARWDWALFVGGVVPALVFGVAVGNVLLGLPFRLDVDLRAHYEGGFLALFAPFALLAGVLSVAMLVLHGAAWLAVKIEPGPVQERARRWGLVAAPLAIALFALGGAWLAYGPIGYRLATPPDPLGASNPLRSTSIAAAGAWLDNLRAHPALWIVPLAGLGGPVLAWLGIRARRAGLAFAGSSLGAIGIIGSVGVSMFPYLLPSSVDPHSSLTAWNASSSATTLAIMLIVTAIFLPLVLAYTAWALAVMRGRVTSREIGTNPDLY